MRSIILNVALLLCAFTLGAQTYGVEPVQGDSTTVWFLQIDSVPGPDSTGIGTEVNIRKLRVTKPQLKQILFSIADQKKRVIEQQDQATAQFENSKQLLQDETGDSYDGILTNTVKSSLSGVYVMQYQGKNFGAEIKNGEVIVDTTHYAINVVDRNTIIVVGLMGRGKDVTFNVNNGVTLIGDYNHKRILFIKQQQ